MKMDFRSREILLWTRGQSTRVRILTWIEDQGSSILWPAVRATATRLIREGQRVGRLSEKDAVLLQGKVQDAVAYWKA